MKREDAVALVRAFDAIEAGTKFDPASVIRIVVATTLPGERNRISAVVLPGDALWQALVDLLAGRVTADKTLADAKLAEFDQVAEVEAVPAK